MNPMVSWPPAPRRVKWKRGRGWSRSQIGTLLFMLPHTLFGIFLLMIATHGLLTLCLGAQTTGIITNRRASRASKSNTMNYRLGYAYRIDGIEHTGETSVSYEEYSALRLANGSRVTVRYLPFLHGNSSLLEEAGHPGREVAGRFGVALFWNGSLWIILLSNLGGPFAQRWLLQNGTPVPGRLTGKTSLTGKSTSYLLHYSFRPQPGLNARAQSTSIAAEEPQSMEGKMSVSHDQWEAAQTGGEVTVLHAPRRPRLNLLPLYSDLELVE